MNLSDMPTLEQCLHQRGLLAGLIAKYERAGAEMFFGWELISTECVARMRMDVLNDLHAQDSALARKIADLGVRDDTADAATPQRKEWGGFDDVQ